MTYKPNLIITSDTRREAISQLVSEGHLEASINLLANVALANLYHHNRSIASVTETQIDAAAIVVKVMQSMQRPAIDEELIRYLARNEAQILIDANPARKLEVTSPRGAITLDGPLHYRTELVIKIAALGHAIMLVGPAGCGKTTIGEHTARALQLPFYITSTINDTHELMGFVDGHGKYHDTPFRNAFEKGGVWIADEIDAWDASALLAANSALANGYCNFPDGVEPISRHADFRMIATANTFGTGADRIYVGRNELDAASLDRFATIDVDYDLTLERMFAAGEDEWLEFCWKVRKIVQDKKIRHVVSSRAVAMGAAALGIGLDRSDVEPIYLFKGMSSSDRKKVEL